MKRVAAYIRVSSKVQNLTGQREAIIKKMKELGISDVEWFEDKESGKSLERESFQRLQDAIAKRKIDAVIVFKLDRISRNMRDGINVIQDWLENGVRLISASQDFDFSGVTGKLIAGVLFAVAEMERQNILERQAEGIAVAKSAGKYKGRKKGATKTKPEEALRLREKHGLSISQIAQQMGVGTATVSRYLKASQK